MNGTCLVCSFIYLGLPWHKNGSLLPRHRRPRPACNFLQLWLPKAEVNFSWEIQIQYPDFLTSFLPSSLTTHRVRDAERVSGGGRPPHHQVGEAGDPEDAAQEGDRKQFASCKDDVDIQVTFQTFNVYINFIMIVILT